jgi:hypothetical protein
MAAASIVFRRSNPSYANELLTHARQVKFLWQAYFSEAVLDAYYY